MPINAFGGGPGSGKTYGVIEHVILPAVADGRFIITNIEGLNIEAIYEYVVQRFYKGKIFCIGHIRQCNREAPGEESFFPGAAQLDKPCDVPAPDEPKVVGGDLVVVDEATRYWPSDEKVKKGHAYFFREHRHFSNELGHTCDLVVIDPDLNMLGRALKGKVEMASVTHKPKEIGFNRYVVNLYRGVKLRGRPSSTEGPYRFKPEIYELYKSYSHAAAKEKAIDKRQNVLRSPKVIVIAVAMVVMLIFCLWGLYAYYRHQKEKFSPETEKPAVVAPRTPAGAASTGGYSVPVARKLSALRVAGEVTLHGERWVVVADELGAIRLENPAAFTGRGILLVGTLEGDRVSTWTGSTTAHKVQQSILGGGK